MTILVGLVLLEGAALVALAVLTVTMLKARQGFSALIFACCFWWLLANGLVSQLVD